MASNPFQYYMNAVSSALTIVADLLSLFEAPAFLVLSYIKQCSNRPGGRYFSAEHLASDVRKIPDIGNGRLRDSSVGVCIERWWRCCRRGAAETLLIIPLLTIHKSAPSKNLDVNDTYVT